MNTKEVGKAFLDHYGTKGMRWGVRRSAAERAKGSGKDSDSKPKTVVGKTKTEGRDASQLSDARLRKVNDRLNMEQQYARLTAKPPGFMGAAKKFASDIALNVAKTQITKLANDAASKQIASMMGGKSNIPKLPDHLRKSNLPRPDALARLG
jgi:hypothetical protein